MSQQFFSIWSKIRVVIFQIHYECLNLNRAAFEKAIEGLPSTRPVGDLPPELHCPLCKEVMKDAVLTSKCCFTSFCDKCKRWFFSCTTLYCNFIWHFPRELFYCKIKFSDSVIWHTFPPSSTLLVLGMSTLPVSSFQHHGISLSSVFRVFLHELASSV